HVPQNPGILGAFSASLRPATPVMLIGVVLNSSSPRAIDRRLRNSSASPRRPSHGLYRSKMCGSNGAPLAFCPSGSFTPGKNFDSCSDRATAPPVAPAPCRLPAFASISCAVKRPLSNATISAIWASVRLRVPERRVLGLAREAHLAAVPHDRAEEAEIG